MTSKDKEVLNTAIVVGTAMAMTMFQPKLKIAKGNTEAERQIINEFGGFIIDLIEASGYVILPAQSINSLSA